MTLDTAGHSHGTQERTGVKSLPMAEPEAAASSLSRRDFLKVAGFTIGAATLSGCRRADKQYAIPCLTPPADIIPGRSYEYTSTCGGCSAGCGLIVKNRDGRPIKLEGNPDH